MNRNHVDIMSGLGTLMDALRIRLGVLNPLLVVISFINVSVNVGSVRMVSTASNTLRGTRHNQRRLCVWEGDEG